MFYFNWNQPATPITVPVPPLLLREQLSVPNFEKGGIRKNMSAWGDLKRSCHGYLPLGLTMFVAQKGHLKLKYGFQGSISHVDIGLF